MSSDCCAPDENIMILACSGGSNVGQLSNQAAIELTQEGFGKMFCLTGIGGHIGGFVQSAKDVPQMVAIDGCQVGCAKAILEQVKVPLKNYVIVSDIGIEKNHEFNLKPEDIQIVKNAVRSACAQKAKAAEAAAASVAGSCCD